MKTLTNLLPNKHVRFAGSLIGIAGYVRQFIDDNSTLDNIWSRIDADKSKFFDIDFTQLILALDILAAIQEVTIDEQGFICRVKNNYETN